jgi:hypothetical protein
MRLCWYLILVNGAHKNDAGYRTVHTAAEHRVKVTVVRKRPRDMAKH